MGVLLLHGGDDPASPAGQRLAAFMRAHSQVGLLPRGGSFGRCMMASSVMSSLLGLAPRVTGVGLQSQASGCSQDVQPCTAAGPSCCAVLASGAGPMPHVSQPP